MTGIEGATSVKMRDNAKVYISNTNDPSFNSTKQEIGVVPASTISRTDKTVGIRFNSNAATTLKEGYWYEINFSYDNASASTASCPGETFIKMCIVPEYATWNSSPRTASTNWNDDNNWLRSTKAEIFKDSGSVFANRFISEICFLNGRKVMTCILKKLKKEKI